jgi:uncharacterized protein
MHMKTLSNVVFAAMLLTSSFVWSADLGESKDAGLVGEREDGYIGFVRPTPPADVTALIQTVNDQRRAEYERIAASNGLTREQVEALAGRKAIERTESGGFIFVGGEWQKKP